MVRLLYVDTKSNSIADALSRKEIGKAMLEIDKKGWAREEYHIGVVFAQWEEKLFERLKTKRVFLSTEQEEALTRKWSRT